MKILVINSGSSSIKFQLFLIDEKQVLASGMVEKIGEDSSILSFEVQQPATNKHEFKERISDHQSGMNRIVELLTDTTIGVIKDIAEVDAVGHRVVHGG
jgi:acetate kinase